MTTMMFFNMLVRIDIDLKGHIDDLSSETVQFIYLLNRQAQKGIT